MTPNAAGRIFIALAAALFAAAAAAVTAEAETAEWPPPADGDFHHVAYADGPRTGRLFVRYLYDWETVPEAAFTTSRIQGLYGLMPGIAIGVEMPYHGQKLGDLNKSGPGDAALQARVHGLLSEDSPLRGGLRASLTLPTGYDEELPPLAPFTSRTHDLLLEGILQWTGSHLNLVAAPGAWLPGGDKSAAATGGLGVDWHRGLPLGLALRGEYFSRYDLVADGFFSEVFGSIRRDLFWGLGFEMGVHRDLLEGGDAPTAVSLRFSKGTPPARIDDGAWRPVHRAVTIVVADPSAAQGVQDPTGFLGDLKSHLISRLSRVEGIYVRTAEEAGSLAFEDGVIVSLDTEIVRMSEGNDRGFSIPHVFASPRATIETTFRMTLRAGVDGPAMHESLKHRRLRRGMGMELIPTGSDEDLSVPPPEVRRALRDEAARRIARDVETELQAILGTIEGY